MIIINHKSCDLLIRIMGNGNSFVDMRHMLSDIFEDWNLRRWGASGVAMGKSANKKKMFQKRKCIM